MKTPEDEAFDEIARRQGAWGGGYQAKRQMAKARVEEDDDIQDYKKPWVGLTDEEIVDVSQHYTEAEGFRHGAEWANAKLKEKNNA
jgi:hypothetical protein